MASKKTAKMELYDLRPAKGSVKKRKRIGRGKGSTRGGTSTRGMEGAKSRSGYRERIGHEGGQMPIQKRVPKYGFRNRNRRTYSVINLDGLQRLIERESELKEIDPSVLLQHGLVKKNMPVKILGDGELKGKVTVRAHKFSAAAKKSIEDQGGEAVTL